MSNISVIAHNLPAMFAGRELGITYGKIAKSAEKLSSGYRINRSADDAAGLAISEKMRRQIRGLTQASKNVQDGVSLCQVADGCLNEVHDMLHRIDELATKGANDTLEARDREYIDDEVQALKSEMRRVFKTANFNEIPLFHVPYTPEIDGYPNNMQLFHIGNGGIGGLEFNNVRYNISELKAEGLKIDDAGIATEDFEAEFDLWDGEYVKLSMKQGQSLSQVSRNYKWKADENGIYINNKLTAEWSEVRYNGGYGLNTSGMIAPGTVSFDHQGMTISFEIDEEVDLADILNGINGDTITKPATWDVRTGGPAISQSADIHEDSSNNRLNVTEANKWFIDYNYSIVADADGIAVKAVNPKDPDDVRVSGKVAWDTFMDSSLATRTDSNGNQIPTNGGYPVIDWGTDNDGNGSGDITFDADATYHFVSPDDKVPIEFDFSLADSASLSEVIAALDGAAISGSGISAPGRLSAVTATSAGQISVGAHTLIARDFKLQRAYGRDFDNPNATLTANITLKRETKAGQPSVADRYTVSGNGHTISSTLNDRTQTGHEITSSSVSYYRVPDETAASGYRYYELTENRVRDTYLNTYDATDTWVQEVNYTFDGDMNGHDMRDLTRTQQETYSRSMTLTQSFNTQYQSFACREIDQADVDPSLSMTDLAAGSDPVARWDGYSTAGETNYDPLSIDESSVGEAHLDRIGSHAFSNLEFNSSDVQGMGTPFTFNFYQTEDQAYALAQTSGEQNLGSIRFTASDMAARTMSPTEKIARISEDQFSNIKLNVPYKELKIQAGAEKDQYIRMRWSPLNLTILGMSGAKTTTQAASAATIDMVKNGLHVISETRSRFGAYQNRFEHAIRNLDNIVENTQRAESQIRDTDMAAEMVRYSNNNMIAQAGQTVLAQANQSKQGTLSLLGR